MATPKLIYSHTDMVSDLTKMYREMHLANYKPDVIVGITRGGLVPGVHVSHYFGAPLITVNVSFRDAMVKEPLTQLVDLIGYQKILLVDDIVDSGETLAYIVSELAKDDPYGSAMNLTTMALIHNEACQAHTPTFHGTTINKVENDVWVCFPWEQ